MYARPPTREQNRGSTTAILADRNLQTGTYRPEPTDRGARGT